MKFVEGRAALGHKQRQARRIRAHTKSIASALRTPSLLPAAITFWVCASCVENGISAPAIRLALLGFGKRTRPCPQMALVPSLRPLIRASWSCSTLRLIRLRSRRERPTAQCVWLYSALGDQLGEVSKHRGARPSLGRRDCLLGRCRCGRRQSTTCMDLVGVHRFCRWLDYVAARRHPPAGLGFDLNAMRLFDHQCDWIGPLVLKI